MLRTFLWLLGAVGLGLVVHIVVILLLPSLAETNIWERISALDSYEKMTVLDDLDSASENQFRLDPELIYGVCQLDLSQGVGIVNARLPDVFWSLAIFDSSGRAVYGTTNRSGTGQMLQLGIFNPEQTKLLASQQLDIAQGLLIIESVRDEIFVVFRVAPPYRAVRERYRNLLTHIICTHS